MGSSESKPKPVDLLNRPDAKPTDIKIDMNNLPKIELSGLDIPKAPPVKTRAMEQREKEEAELKSLIEFRLGSEHDLGTYSGRFGHQMSCLNPMMFFKTDA